MSERYSKLFSLPQNLYAEGSLVIVSAGNLLKDNQTGRILAQLKIKNISQKPVKAATVLVHAFDTAGSTIDGDTEQEYLDLSVKQGEEFGQKTAIPLPNASTRGFSVEVTKVVFDDNSVWDGTDAAWEPLPVGESLSHNLRDPELEKQYRIHFGGKCEIAPRTHKDLWLCACGNWNRVAKCYHCGKEKSAQLGLDLNKLNTEKDARLAKEKAEREAAEAAEKAAAEAKKAMAEQRAKRTKKVLAVTVLVLLVSVAAYLLTAKIILPNIRISEAAKLFESGNYEEGYALLEELGESSVIGRSRCARARKMIKLKNYIVAYVLLDGLNDEDSLTLKAEIKPQYIKAQLANAKPGDYVIFGSYEQDNEPDNGKEDIEWLVLAKENNRILVISRYALDCIIYHTSSKAVTWENSAIRGWLNNSFYNAAFDREERAMIPKVTVNADKNSSYKTSSGNSTEDHVFLLSIAEKNAYFASDAQAVCKATPSVVAKGCYVRPGTVECVWWLRTPGSKETYAAVVSADGSAYEVGNIVIRSDNTARPALWIDLNS